MAKLLGLDLGTYSLKAAVIETQFRAHALTRLEEVRCTPGDFSGGLPSALAELGALVGTNFDGIAVALPGPRVATHHVGLPFSDDKRIEAALAFEVGNELPFDTDEVVLDYQVAHSDASGSQLLVGLARRSELAQLLGTLKSSGFEPRVVTHPALVYQGLFSAGALESFASGDATALALIDIGHERTCIAIGRPGGNIEAARAWSGGGLHLTRAIAAEFGIEQTDAQAWKEAHGTLRATATGDQARGRRALEAALNPWIRELRPTLKSYSARTHKAVTHLVLCGGTSQLDGLVEHLQELLGISVARLPESQTATVALSGRSALSFTQAQALAERCAAPAARAPRFNLRRGEFAVTSEFDFVRAHLGRLVGYAAVLFLLLVAGGIARLAVLQKAEKAIDDSVCALTEKTLRRCERNLDVALSLLRGKEGPTAALPRKTAVNLLAELVSRVPQGMSLSFEQVDVQLDRIAIRSDAGSPKQVEELAGALRGHPCFREVKEGKIEKSRDGQKVNFRLDIQVDCAPATAPKG